MALPSSDAALEAQRVIYRLIESDRANFGVYGDRSCSARTVLHDIKALTTEIVMRANRDGWKQIAARDRAADTIPLEQFPSQPTIYQNNKVCLAPPTTAVESATAFTAALSVLQAPSLEDASEIAARLLIPPPTSRRVSSVSGFSATNSPVASAAVIKASTETFSAIGQLRHQTVLALPGVPAGGYSQLTALARRTSSSMWPGWFVRLAPPDLRSPALAPAMACMTLLVNSRMPIREAVDALGGLITSADVSSQAGKLSRRRHWTATCMALTRLNAYLSENEIPVDYARRRTLDYSSLLPVETWNQICSETDSFAGTGVRAEVARLYLFEKVSTLSPNLAPFAREAIQPAVCGPVRNFPAAITPRLAARLNEVATKFLDQQGIYEPVTWHPPLTLLDELDLAGSDPGNLDPDHLTEARLKDRTGRIEPIARRLGVTGDIVRYLLERDVPEAGGTGAGLAAASGYRVEKMCASYGSGVTVSNDASERQSLSASRPEQFNEWLYIEYAINRRTAADIAVEAGLTRMAVRDWIDKCRPGWPERPESEVGGLSELAAGQSLARLADTATHRRWLLHFAQAVEYSSIGEAAAALGLHRTAMQRQIRFVKNNMADPLLEPGRRGMPMRWTRFAAAFAELVISTVSPASTVSDWQLDRLRRELPVADFLKLYDDEHRSLDAIARLHGVNRKPLRRLADEYAIVIRDDWHPANK
ncbi:LysR family transcriptional regulator [Mycobacterium sp. AT1]|uniref:helix-turn-helix domain-containing protein n=1 Tax=Mycobacterium sp. AT1 TaxID=1961706 RepID=UPI001E29AED3|nr:LysR family transcriptional regulator [Mycobacterium sp. AT1]